MRQTVYPLMLYQMGPKFRDENVVGYGLLRSREFLMNDLYSFDITEENASETYRIVSEVSISYYKKFKTCTANIISSLKAKFKDIFY